MIVMPSCIAQRWPIGGILLKNNDLSQREAEIAKAYAGGATYRTIAERFGIAPSTARSHLGTIYRKLEVSSKIELLQRLNYPVSASTGDASPLRPTIRTKNRPSVVVLPFENRSGEPDQDALISGLVESVTAMLSRFRMLSVISSASGLSYRDSGKDLPTIAKELSVRYVVRGVFNRTGDRLRVSAELVDVDTGAHLWSQNIDGVWSNIFTVQDDFSCAIACAIEPEIQVHELELARRQQTDRLNAWELFCRGFHSAYKFTPDGYREARKFSEQAIEADDYFAGAHALLSRVHLMEALLGISPDPPSSFLQGIACARRALDIDEREEIAYACLSCNLVMTGAFDEAFVVMDHAFQINSNHAELYNARAFAHVFSSHGDFQQVISDSEAALKMSPNHPMRWTFLTNIGMAQLADEQNGSVAEALKAFRASSLAARSSWMPSSGAAMAALALGDQAEFDLHIKRAKVTKPDLTYRENLQAFGHLMERSPRVRDLMGQLAQVFP